jgi:hypothetical protein
VNCYQLACGHWQTDHPGYAVGGLLGCTKCNTLRTLIVGMSATAVIVMPGNERVMLWLLHAIGQRPSGGVPSAERLVWVFSHPRPVRRLVPADLLINDPQRRRDILLRRAALLPFADNGQPEDSAGTELQLQRVRVRLLVSALRF